MVAVGTGTVGSCGHRRPATALPWFARCALVEEVDARPVNDAHSVTAVAELNDAGTKRLQSVCHQRVVAPVALPSATRAQEQPHTQQRMTRIGSRKQLLSRFRTGSVVLGLMTTSSRRRAAGSGLLRHDAKGTHLRARRPVAMEPADVRADDRVDRRDEVNDIPHVRDARVFQRLCTPCSTPENGAPRGTPAMLNGTVSRVRLQRPQCCAADRPRHRR